jgi:hypothetical protein
MMLRLFLLFSLLASIHFFTFKTNGNWLSQSKEKSNSKMYNEKKFNSVTIYFTYDFDNTKDKLIYNSGESQLNVHISKGVPNIIITDNISFINGHAECYFKDTEVNNFEFYGHMDIDVSLFFTGKWDRIKLIEKYKNHIKDKLKDKFLL